MRLRPVVTALLNLGAPIAGCRSDQSLHDLYDPAMLAAGANTLTTFLETPIVLVGLVTGVNAVGAPRQARRSPGTLLQLTRVELHVENMLRGKVESRNIKFYFFGFSDKNPAYIGLPRYQVAIGERRIFFLTTELGRLRSVGDVLDYTLPVASGFHENIRAEPEVPLRLSIPEVLLSVGKGSNPRAMSATLSILCPVSDYLAPQTTTVRLLKDLISGSDKGLAAASCLYLAENYHGQYSCLDDLLSSAQLDQSILSRARELQELNRQRDERLKDQIARYPLQAFPSIMRSGSVSAIHEELLLLLDDPDANMKALACSALIRLYPYPEPRCAPRAGRNSGVVAGDGPGR